MLSQGFRPFQKVLWLGVYGCVHVYEERSGKIENKEGVDSGNGGKEEQTLNKMQNRKNKERRRS